MFLLVFVVFKYLRYIFEKKKGVFWKAEDLRIPKQNSGEPKNLMVPMKSSLNFEQEKYITRFYFQLGTSFYTFSCTEFNETISGTIRYFFAPLLRKR